MWKIHLLNFAQGLCLLLLSWMFAYYIHAFAGIFFLLYKFYEDRYKRTLHRLSNYEEVKR